MKRKFKFILITTLLLISITLSSYSQGVGINEDGSTPDVSAILDVKSSVKGILIPRLSLVEIMAMPNLSNSLIVFNTSDNKFYTYIQANNEWKEIAYGAGTISGPFSCGYTLVDSRDGKSYSTVQIGTQCWMAENLNIGTMINGSSSQTDNSSIEKYCYIDNLSNCDTYGGLYQWDEMMQYVTTEGSQGICPIGWHLPSDTEWTTLTDYLGDPLVVGGKLKEAGTSHWSNPNTGATNISGFTGIPSGYKTGGFAQMGTETDLWSSTEINGSAKTRILRYNSSLVLGQDYPKYAGFSVRCVMD